MPSKTEPKLDPALKRKWVKALRSAPKSGPHQCKGQLFTPNGGSCALGVFLSVLHGSRERAVAYATDPNAKPHWEDMHLASHAIESVIELNDGAGKTFPEIADWVEANL